MREGFSLEPGRVALNHGSFGAVPRVVQERQAAIRARCEANPMRFFRVELQGLVEAARGAAAEFLGADEVALVRNPTEAVATVLSALAWQGRLGPGDAVVVSEQGYGAMTLAVQQWCTRTGASYAVARLPLEADAVEAYREAFHEVEDRGDVVRLVIVDHITSPTGTVLPYAEVAALAHAHGAVVLVDGAHVPGHVPADVGAGDFWTGTFHKWAFAPRGTSVLWVAEAERDAVAPLSTSWRDGRPFPQPFDLRGTDDYSGWAALPAALEFWSDAGGWDIATEARLLLDDAAPLFGRSARCTAPCLRLVPLPEGVAETAEAADGLYESLGRRGLEAQVTAFGGRGHVRLSATVYNELSDYERLAEALKES
ncbi:MAG: aminotransferase class V-fold PLP-dependent enzyme [Nocardioidaceae bacterium]